MVNEGAESLERELERKLRDCAATVGVIGLGYVGLPLALALAEQGFVVRGFDINSEKIRSLAGGQSHIRDVPPAAIHPSPAHWPAGFHL